MINHPLPTHGTLVPYGLLVHTTGDGLAAKCLASGDPVKTTIDTYAAMNEGPHYAIVPDGTTICFADPTAVRWHAAVSAADRASFLSGDWTQRVPAGVASWWALRWPGVKSPQHLYPAKSPNFSYVGVELIPCGVYQGNQWEPVMGTPATSRGRYSAEQYMAVALLAQKLHKEHAVNVLDPKCMLAHEDVNPVTRPGWDVGAYHGWWSWSLFRGMLKTLIGGI